MIRALENFIFAWRGFILTGLVAITVISLYWATQLRPDAGFIKQLPMDHEYVKTHFDHAEFLGTGNKVLIALETTEGTIWDETYLRQLKAVTDDVFFLPGIAKQSVRSLWTSNVQFIEIDEQGFRSSDLIPGTITEKDLSPEQVELIKYRTIQAGYRGQLVSYDYRSALIIADVMEYNPATGQEQDMLAVARALESLIRDSHQSDRFRIHIIGLTKMYGDVADSATAVIQFFGIALLLTAFFVYLYSRSLVLTLLPLGCSLASLTWQFALLEILGFGLDPLAILVPFLIFAIGVSHGIQQINQISQRLTEGASSEDAARSSFHHLLVPGSMALITDLVGFGTLWFINIGMIREMAITASIGIALKIVTNLIMLPLAVSYFKFSDRYRQRIGKAREKRKQLASHLKMVTSRKGALIVLGVSAIIFTIAVLESRDRVVGDLHPGSPILKFDHRYNEDSRFFTSNFEYGIDILVVVNEMPPQSCINYEAMKLLDDFAWYMQNVPGVKTISSAPAIVKRSVAAFMEGNPKFQSLPRNRYTLVLGGSPLDRSSTLLNEPCDVMTLLIFLEDGKAETISRATDAVKKFRTDHELILRKEEGTDVWNALTREDVSLLRSDVLNRIRAGEFAHPEAGRLADVYEDDGTTLREGTLKNIQIRLASGNSGLFGAINEEIAEAEMPMMLVVYLVIILLVLATYRDWRAALCCCLPLTFATFAGYWFMNVLEIGLKVSTLPVMVLAVGVGVDYAFYIYNRLQSHVQTGEGIEQAYAKAASETGVAVLFTATTLALGVFTWIFADLKFQADMGALLAFMFIINAIGALIILPAMAVQLERLLPRH